jgi:ABC-type sugar transport system permease subunit
MNVRSAVKSSVLKYWEGTLFITPWLIGFVVFVAFPIGYSFYMSFQDLTVTATKTSARFVGLAHYKTILLADGSLLYNQLIPFLQQTLFMIPIIVVFALLVAIMLNQKFAGRTFFRAIFFLPVIMSTGGVVQEFLSTGQGSLEFMQRYNFAAVIQSSMSSTWANPLIAILGSFVLILWYSGVQILIFLGGRQTISNSAYEAARIDGASPWDIFWKITLPAMTPFIFLNLIYTVVDLFTYPTNPVLQKVKEDDYGQFSALIWIYFAVICIVLAVIFAIFSRVTKTQRNAA